MSNSDSTKTSRGHQFHQLPFDPGEKYEINRSSALSGTKSEEQASPESARCHNVDTNMTVKSHQESSVSDDGDSSGISVSLYKNSVPVVAVSESVDPANGNDFGYSQKLFHIADGNLYSVFSPIQGRSYGIRPAFLRRQRGAGRQARGRGRRCHRRGLKFHNFVPSEASASERNALGSDESRSHAECMLREEHGTKQITASHWSATAENTQNDDSMNSDMTQDNVCNEKSEVDELPNQSSMESFNISNQSSREIRTHCEGSESPLMNISSISALTNSSDASSNPNANKSQHGILEMLLSVSKPARKRNGAWQLMHDKLLNENKAAASSHPDDEYDDSHSDDIIIDWEASSLSSSRNKHRRKPVQTRRVVPYSEYLSMVEDGDEPLDLSCHSRENSLDCFFAKSPLKNLPPAIVNAATTVGFYDQGCNTCSVPTSVPIRNIWNSNPIEINPPYSRNELQLNYDNELQCSAENKANQQRFFVPNRPLNSVHDEPRSSANFFGSRSESYQPKHPSSVSYFYPVGTVARPNDAPRYSSKSKIQPLYQYFTNQDVPSTSHSAYNKIVNILPNLPASAYATTSVGNRKEASLKGRIEEQFPVCSASSSQQHNVGSAEHAANSYGSGFLARSQISGTSDLRRRDSGVVQTDFKVPRAQRRPSQRTLIRQKLEDAFRQNGFLVKTKQVPVGEATFCKFRQLRKYTRYYLKSWHQHLPEEVHKLWKGFLPPKTAVAQAAAGRLEDHVIEGGGSGVPSKGAS